MGCKKLYDVYSKLEEENIAVNSVSFLKEEKAVAFKSPESNVFWIGINHNRIHSEREELCVIMEEKAHYDVGIVPNNFLSNSYCDRLTREKNELKAKKLAVKRLVPKDKLLNYIKDHYYLDLDELADYFEVTPQFMKQALGVYGLN